MSKVIKLTIPYNEIVPEIIATFSPEENIEKMYKGQIGKIIFII